MPEPTATLIAEARELCAKATPPPWGYSEMSPLHEGLYRWAEICTDDDSVVIAETDQEGNIRVHPGLNDDSPQFEADGKFMARSRTLLPALADDLEKATETNREVVDILDDFYAPIARSIDGSKPVDMSDLKPMTACMAKLMGVWLRLRPESRDAEIVRNAATAKQQATLPELLDGQNLSVVDWIGERYENAKRLAATKTGEDRDGWMEDARYLHDAHEALKGSARDAERIVDLSAKLAGAIDERDEARSMLASCTDLANSWAREHSVPEARDERTLQQLIAGLWNEMMRKLGASRERLAAAQERIQRLTDLVRYQRHEIHTTGLISDEEYSELAQVPGAVARLESYDEFRFQYELKIQQLKVIITDVCRAVNPELDPAQVDSSGASDLLMEIGQLRANSAALGLMRSIVTQACNLADKILLENGATRTPIVADGYNGAVAQAVSDVGELVTAQKERMAALGLDRDKWRLAANANPQYWHLYTLESRLTKAREPLLELEQSCPCGARPESLKTHPHVTGCLVAAALAILNDPAVVANTQTEMESPK